MTHDLPRPATIARYELLYLASFVVGLIGTVIAWPARLAVQRTTPLADATWLLPTTVGVSIVTTLLLWWYTARRPSLIARVIVTIFAVVFGLGILVNLFALVSGAAVSVPGALTAVVSSALFVAATVYLYHPDSRAWFGESNVEGVEP